MIRLDYVKMTKKWAQTPILTFFMAFTTKILSRLGSGSIWKIIVFGSAYPYVLTFYILLGEVHFRFKIGWSLANCCGLFENPFFS